MEWNPFQFILRNLGFDAGAVTVGAGLVEIGGRLVLFSFYRFGAAAFAGFAILIIPGFAGKDVQAVLFFAAAGRGTGLFLGVKVADIPSSAVAIFALNSERFRLRLRRGFILPGFGGSAR